MGEGWAEFNEPATKRQRMTLHRFFGLYDANPDLVKQFSWDEADTVIAIFAKHAAAAASVETSSEETK